VGVGDSGCRGMDQRSPMGRAMLAGGERQWAMAQAGTGQRERTDKEDRKAGKGYEEEDRSVDGWLICMVVCVWGSPP
jgi:hypothetical protein